MQNYNDIVKISISKSLTHKNNRPRADQDHHLARFMTKTTGEENRFCPIYIGV